MLCLTRSTRSHHVAHIACSLIHIFARQLDDLVE